MVLVKDLKHDHKKTFPEANIDGSSHEPPSKTSRPQHSSGAAWHSVSSRV